MLSERSRNVIVGLTMVVAFAVLGYGIVLLGRAPHMFGSLAPYRVLMTTTNANGLTAGSHVQINGVDAGMVESVWLDEQHLVNSHLQIESGYTIPSDAVAMLSKPQLGSPLVIIDTTGTSGPPLPKDGTARLKAVAGDNGLIPKQVFDDIHNLKEQLSTVANDLHVMLAYTTPEDLQKADPKDPNRPRENISTVVIKLNRTIDSVQKMLTDENIQSVHEIVKNIMDASKQIKSTIEKFDTTVDHANGAVTSITRAADSVGVAATQASDTLAQTKTEIVRISQKLADLLEQVQKSARDITEGKGTTGRLVTDPRLYEGLLDLSVSLKKAADDLDFLVKKWKDEGVDLRLK
jgi:ABC-type transporter Mla subunit MlaD